MKSREELRRLWVIGLRSGEYRQGKSWLKTPDGAYCCLGVLCEIAGILGDDGQVIGTRPSSVGIMPADFAEHMGMTQNGMHRHGGSSKQLTIMNDQLGFSFRQIADAIETGEYWK